MTTPLAREQFPITERFRYFNHAGTSPVPLVVADVVERWTDHMLHAARVGHDAFDEECERARTTLAALMGVDRSGVAFTKNTTEGLGFVASGLRWRPGDRVVVARYEYPSTIYPWRALADDGVEVDLLEPLGAARELPLELFAGALARGAGRVRLVAVSWVQYGRGWRTDLAALASLCHEHGALLCADIVQGLGVVPCELEAWGVDLAMAAGHKWLLAPRGSGVFYASPAAIEQVRPTEPGEASVADRGDWDQVELVWAPDARRYEGGTVNTVGTMGLGASAALLQAAGIDAVWAHVDGLCERLRAGLREAGAQVLSADDPAGRSGIVSFMVDGWRPTALAEHLVGAGFAVVPRADAVRAAPHGYNTADEVDALVAAVANGKTSVL